MSAKHTPGRLYSLQKYPSVLHSKQGDRGRRVCCTESFGDKDENEANARRLAACWNACEGIPTNDLEGKSIGEYVSQQAFITGMNPSPEGMDLGIKGLAAQMMAASFAGQFIGNGAVNYLEMRFSHPDVGPFTVTIQRTQGLTPTQKLKHVEAQRDALLANARAAIATAEKA